MNVRIPAILSVSQYTGAAAIDARSVMSAAASTLYNVDVCEECRMHCVYIL
jgi:hypothetical protein